MYLKGTPDLGITYRGSSDSEDDVVELVGYAESDADFASCPIDSKSRTGYVIMVAGGPITWFTKKQTVVAPSTCAAEYIALHELMLEMLSIKELIEDIGFTVAGPMIAHQDNQSTVAMAEAEAMTRRARHIRVHFHDVRDIVQSGEIVLKLVPTEDQLADMFTKSLATAEFQRQRDRIMSKVKEIKTESTNG